MLYKTLLSITKKESFREIISVLIEAGMVILLLLALLTADSQEINFIYANF